MKQRGRPSGASRAIAPRGATEIIERLSPPKGMGVFEVEIWSAIVEGHPPDWFSAGSVPLLVQLCRHVALSDCLAELIDGNGNEEDWLGLLKEQRQESAIICRLATSLRLTPQSLIDHTSGNKKQITAVNRPWAFAHKS